MKIERAKQAASIRTTPSSDGEGGLQLGQLVGAIQRNVLLIIGVTITVGVLAQLKAVTEEPVYTGGFEILTKSVTVESEVISTLPGTLANRQQETVASTINETTIRVLRSEALLNPLVKKLRSRYPSFSYAGLVSNLSVQLSGPDILAVIYRSEDPKLVKDVLNLLSQTYLNYSLEERQKDVRQGIAFVEEQLPQLQARVTAQQEKLQKFRQTYNLIDPELQAQQFSHLQVPWTL
jgi:succinoglycan biosynthesis transport protein ExoP